MGGDDMSLPFDEVRFDGRAVPSGEFLRLPLHERIRHILGGDLSFFAGGEPVESTLALQALRKQLVEGA